jgi:hypothetical protein
MIRLSKESNGTDVLDTMGFCYALILRPHFVSRELYRYPRLAQNEGV